MVDGIVLVALDQAVDHAVEGGREQQGLVVAVDVAEQPLDLRQEAHVGHAVGLVDHHDLEAAELDLLAVDQVDQPAGRGDDRLDPVGDGLDLLVHVRSAVDGDDPAADGLGERCEHVVDLERQLAGRDQHQAARAAGLGVGQALEQGQAEGQRLAGAGLGLPADVAPGEGVGDREGLDGEGPQDPLVGEGT